MNSAVINLRVDPVLKAKAKAYADDMGLDLSTVIDNLLRYVLKTKSLAFTPDGAFPIHRASKRVEKKIERAQKHPEEIIWVDDVNAYLKQL